MHLSILKAGRLHYDDAFSLQERLVERVKAAPDAQACLLLVEHPPVLTIGRSGDESDFIADRPRLASEGMEVRKVNRGGRTTYHGPGQLVGYPIIALRAERRDVHRYLRSLEAVLIATLKCFDINSFRREGLTGVWTERGKIAAIGVGISRWVTYHGFALNVDPDLAHFKLIHPCGLHDISVTSMAKLLGRAVSMEEAGRVVIEEFRREFEFDGVVECKEIV